jgi:hypothetical protein
MQAAQAGYLCTWQSWSSKAPLITMVASIAGRTACLMTGTTHS